MSELCYLCLGGPGRQRVKGYNIWVCQSCWQRAAKGWPKEYEPSLFQALQRAGLLIPDRNPLKLLPREYHPPGDFAL